MTNPEPAVADPALLPAVMPVSVPEPVRRKPGVWMLVVVTVLAVAGGASGIFGFDDMLGHGRLVTYNSYSMSPTLTAPTNLVVTSEHGPLHRGDLVLVSVTQFGSTRNSREVLTVRRVIGIGGDHLVCCDEHGDLQVNGKPVDEDYLTKNTAENPQQTFDVEVPPGAVFLAGDDRNNSVDSRLNVDSPSRGSVREQDVDSLVVGTGNLVARHELPPTTAFTKAGLPGDPSSDTGYARNRTFVATGLALFVLGIAGVIIVCVLRHRRRRVPQAQ